MKNTLSVDRQSNQLYKQIYDYILNRIERSEWKEHDKLPSIRTLAQEMNVHRLTVFKAYQLLKQNGKVYVKDKSGYHVHPDSCVPFEHLDYPIVSSYFLRNHLSEIHQVPATYQFSQALIDPNLLPNLYFSEYVKKVFDLYPKVLGTYSTVQGDEELREALSCYFLKRHQLHLSADEILITSGAQQAIDLISRILVKPNDTVLLERPTYSAAIDIFRQQGAHIVPIDIYPGGYDLEQVESCMRQYKPRLFYLNPTFQNPTGYTVPPEQRKRLVDLAEQYRCLLVEDDPFHDAYFDREPPLPLFTYDTEGSVMYIRSFSKYVAPGLRIAAVASRPPLMRSLLTAKSLSDNGTPLLNQKIFLHYFSSARLQQHLEKLRIALHIRKGIMEEELAVTDWKWISPKGGLNLWIKLPETIPMEELLIKSIEQSVSFVPGILCDPLRESASWIRLSYSYANEQQLHDGVQRLINLSRSLASSESK
ncbi:PLP-dependent aminotransferase family protein [Aneurinibacillus migulanus]|uniref:aminotransferase-like domain-containing protein n=1 Tax=Aneurinibacillus migulanus TaxID=47500 RepID=UPI0020A17E08|nr:PLP-dependent aminotransferase family protein [Aneurinibacillus migulanus]MCP1358877.1 PLP-dependent aminotransferase family protein [Aneurinibacillus migulanus]